MACGIEVLADWNRTLFEINVLRSAVRQKGESYVGILAKASDDELRDKDKAGLERLSSGIFDDEEAAYVRFTDDHGTVVWDRVKPTYEERYKETHQDDFRAHYQKLMERDTTGMLDDPEDLQSLVNGSRFRDFAQAWTDTTAAITAVFSAPPPKPPNVRGVIVYEDRIRGEAGERDDKLTYAIGMVHLEGKTVGTVIVAFDMTKTNDAVRAKMRKFGGTVLFFIALISVQNIMSRRNKLRLLDLEVRYREAKAALRAEVPKGDVRSGVLVASGALDQAKGPVDGMVWDAAQEDGSVLALAIDPDGDGIDAASVGLHVARTFEARRKGGQRVALDEEVRALGEAAGTIPLTRPIGIALLRLEADGSFEAVVGTFASLRVLDKGQVSAPDLVPIDEEAPPGVVGPLARAKGKIEAGAALVAFCAGMSKKDAKVEADAVARYLLRTHEAGKTLALEDAVIWARGRNSALAENDVALIAVAKNEAS